ncbi:hypothetical protein SSX86_028543 [Deinandra increscens subsp. villosa]|uniref:NB-ARC domain-containing protein n=1 Tax=Deinandra increscens subsp. villosa TaxID=3103831 RepID=A0AAP0GLG7_9ASTR
MRDMMAHTGLELFMEKLKRMIYMKDNPLVRNHPSVLSERPQFQLLYEKLGSMIQTLFVENENNLHELDEIKNLKKRLKDVAEDAHDTVDLFVSDIILRSKRLPRRSDDSEGTLDLEDIMKSILSIKEEFISIRDDSKMDSSPKTDLKKTQYAAVAGISGTRNLARSKTVWHEITVGLDHDAALIRDRLVDDQKELNVVSIVGMGGLGKTTLATKLFNDRFVVYHFDLRAWVTVSQTYEKHDLLIQIMSSLGLELDTLQASYSRLREMLHKSLMGKRYLIVIDDIWSTKAWDDLKLFFPNENNRSRLLLTSRLKEVAYHARPDGFIHQLRYLTDEESWELLRKKVFHGNDCPEPLIKHGMQIAENCHGLPLALVLIAGILEKEVERKDSWQRIARSVTSYIFSDMNWHMETLALSINHLPPHVRDCFLYLGGFREDYMFNRRRLIWLWVAEGFIQETRNQSLEETAEEYLMELVDRNLVVVHNRNSNGAIKRFSVHDVLRELCLEIATKERFYLRIPETHNRFNHFEAAPYKKLRIFADKSVSITNALRIRSYLSFYSYPATSYRVIKFSHSWMILMVLDLWHTKLDNITSTIALLVHLRYLAIWYDGDFPSSICNLWSLQTLIIRRDTSLEHLVFPKTISNLVNLRHLKCDTDVWFPRIWKRMNLLTISKVMLSDGAKNFVRCVPSIKKLTCLVNPDMKYDFGSLKFLETLRIGNSDMDDNMYSIYMPRCQKTSICFPSILKKLTLEECHLPWSSMSGIQSLPHLEVLRLLRGAFVGSQWDAGEEPFRQLKFLQLQGLDIKQWEASSTNFPCLRQLVVQNCDYLKEIPIEIGYIPTLEHIIINTCQNSLVDSVDKIQEEQYNEGNFDLKITVRKSWKYSWFPFPRNILRLKILILSRYMLHYPHIAPHHLEILGVQVNHPPIIPACQFTNSSRIQKGWRPNRRLFKRIL